MSLYYDRRERRWRAHHVASSNVTVACPSCGYELTWTDNAEAPIPNPPASFHDPNGEGESIIACPRCDADIEGFVPCPDCEHSLVDPDMTGADGRSVCDACRDLEWTHEDEDDWKADQAYAAYKDDGIRLY